MARNQGCTDSVRRGESADRGGQATLSLRALRVGEVIHSRSLSNP
jgi:hypothetical protein